MKGRKIVATHGGFAAVLSLRQRVLQDYVTIAYGTETLNRLVANIFSPAPVSALLLLAVPQVECRATDNGRVRIRLRGVGALGVEVSGPERERRAVTTDSTVLVTPAVGWHEVSPGVRSFGLHFRDAVTESSVITPVHDGPFSDEAQLVVDAFVPTATAQVVLGLLGELDLAAVIDPSVFGGVAKAASAAGITIVKDGEIAFAIDVNEETESGVRVFTTGTPAMVPALAPGTDIGFVAHRRAVPLVFAAFESALRAAGEDQGATLGLYGIATTDGAFAVNGRLSKSSGHIGFSFRAVPQMITPVVETRYEDDDGRNVVERSGGYAALWFKADDVAADASLSWWAAFAAVVVPPVGVPVAFALLNGREEDLREAIRSGRNAVPRERRYLLGDGGSPIITTKLEQFVCSDDEVVAATTFSRTAFGLGSIDGPKQVSVEGAIAEPPTYRFELPFAVFTDHECVVHWTVRDGETQMIVAQERNLPDPNSFVALVKQTFTLPSDLAYLAEPTLVVSVRVVRELGAVTEPLFAASMIVKVRDTLDRSHPYLRWRHEVRVPSVRVETDGTRTIQGYPLRRRTSKIHRTAIPGRCRMISRMSLNRVTEPDPVPPVVGIEYLDALPFARAELESRRSEVCEYCFYGGPGKPISLID